MQHIFLIGSLLLVPLLLVLAGSPVSAQAEVKPVRISEIRRALRFTPQTPSQIEMTNRALIDAIKLRGINFALSAEEEWALTLEEAGVELLQAIRDALPDQERERLLKVREQEGLYYAFANNYSQADVGSRLVAISAGREFIRRYRDDANVADIVTFLQRAVPALERSIRTVRRPSRGRPRTN